MSLNVQNFIENFQDMFVIKVNTLTSFPNNLSNIELNLINSQLEDITNRLTTLSELTVKGSKENLEEYIKIIEILHKKLDYIEDLSDMLMYINSFYDMNNVLDIFNHNLNESSGENNLIFDNEQKSLTLKGVTNNFNCPKEMIDGTTFIYYNTNLSFHSGIYLHSDYLDIISIKSITLIKVDGTVVKLPFTNFSKNYNYIKHDYLNSTQISIEFNENILALPIEQQEYYKSLKISLMDYKYTSEGNFVLDPYEYKASKTLNYIYNTTIPNDTFINLNLNIDLKDINKNKINTVTTTLSIGTQKICKQLDNIDFNTVQSIIGIYINDKYKENVNNKITIDYLNSLENKNEIYVIYLKKQREEDILNNYFSVLNNQGIVFKNRNIKYITVYPLLEFYSFNENLSPSLKILTGVTKL